MNRKKGARGQVKVPYKITPGSAKMGKDFKATKTGFLKFENEETRLNFLAHKADKYSLMNIIE